MAKTRRRPTPGDWPSLVKEAEREAFIERCGSKVGGPTTLNRRKKILATVGVQRVSLPMRLK